MTLEGLQCLADSPSTRTNLRAFDYDADATGAYPSSIMVANVSKETTKRELIKIDGIEEDVFRLQNINLVSSGHVNAIEYGHAMFGLPTSKDLLRLYQDSKK